MKPDELQAALENAGLTSYQSEAYLTVLDLGITPAVKVAQNSSIPTSQIYKILRDLERQGYVETIDRDQLHVRPTEPEVVLDQLRSQGRRLQDAADDIEDRWERPHLTEHGMSVVKHQETIIERARETFADSESLIEAVLTGQQFESLLPALREAKSSGVVVRVSVYADPESKASVEELPYEDAVTELRWSYIPGPSLAVVDRRHCYFTPNTRAPEQYGVMIDDDILSFIFHWYFYTCNWSLNERAYVDTDDGWSFVTLEEFIQDFSLLFDESVDVSIVATGYDNQTHQVETVSGQVIATSYQDDFRIEDPPSIDQLASGLTVTIDDDGSPYTIGSWGSIFEDMEAYRIHIDEISLVPPSQDRSAAVVDLTPDEQPLE
ncbi:TrmB family transcriptional regulator [Halorhabdus salina]|uniref:TrmB family transcriptional regulator n=1 Tax=Halorhabdus salina TaxID=2750670 RepID=UPI0015EF2652|nr:TrmB family transcriptional regulator sugar-binding domain-containing protein [Halorhabdus salina]